MTIGNDSNDANQIQRFGYEIIQKNYHNSSPDFKFIRNSKYVD